MESGGRLAPLELREDELHVLEASASALRTPQAAALRARIVLACAEGHTNEAIATSLGVTSQTVAKWRQRFEQHGLEGLNDAPRPGAPRRIEVDDLEWVLTLTLFTMPASGARWTTRALAEACGMSQSAISRAWKGFGLRPSSSKRDHQRRNRLALARLEDLLRLRLNPASRARVRTHRVKGRQELRAWLAGCDAALGSDERLDLILTECRPADEEEARSWLGSHPRLTLRVAPEGKLWGDLVASWFGPESRAPSCSGLHRLADEREPTSYVWTPLARTIIESGVLAAGGANP